MTDHQLNAEAISVIEKVKKLLALASNNANENEAASATSKAMELLAAYNLDMAMVGKTAKGSQRRDNKLKGGLYGWQRDLWKAVAELNFCMHWSIKGLSRGSTYEHRILGREENVISAQLMAEYLQGAVERLAREYSKTAYPGASIFIKEMIAYREGMAQRLTERLNQLRRDRLREDEERQAAARANAPTGNGTDLVLASVIDDEVDLNYDHLWGYEPGTTGKARAEAKVRQAAATAAFLEELAKQNAWDEEHPVEAAARRQAEQAESDKINAKWAEEDRKRANRPTRWRMETPKEARARMHTFAEGYDKGDDVGLDKQVSDDKKHRIAK